MIRNKCHTVPHGIAPFGCDVKCAKASPNDTGDDLGAFQTLKEGHRPGSANAVSEASGPVLVDTRMYCTPARDR